MKVMKSVVNAHRVRHLNRRRSYRNYKRQKLDWLPIFVEVEEGKTTTPPRTAEDIAKRHDIPPTTLRRRYSEWVKGGKTIIGTTDNRGGNNRAFAKEDEEKLANDVRERFTNIHRPFVDADLSQMALDLKDQGVVIRTDIEFKASHRFITRFKREHDFVSGKGRAHKSAVVPATVEDLISYRTEGSLHLARVGSILFISFDETRWWLVNLNTQLWFNKSNFPPHFYVVYVAFVYQLLQALEFHKK